MKTTVRIFVWNQQENTGLHLESSCNIVLAHPKYVKAIRSKKTDKRDAKWIADIFTHDLVSGSVIPPADIRRLKDLMRFTEVNSLISTLERKTVHRIV